MMTKLEHTILLIDGDIICYKSAAAAQKTSVVILKDGYVVGEYKNITEARAQVDNIEEYEIEQVVYPEPLSHALHNVKRAITKIEEDYKPCSIIIALSDSTTYRHKIATVREYKGHRDPSAKPEHLADCKKYISEKWSTCIMEGLEADDVLGILANRYRLEGHTPIVCSSDKDLDQIPGLHYNWSLEKPGYFISNIEANYNLYLQMISGDSTDNIPGIEGIGKKLAEGKLARFKLSDDDIFKHIENMYIEKYGWDAGPKRFNETYQLVRICRHEGDHDELKKAASESF